MSNPTMTSRVVVAPNVSLDDFAADLPVALPREPEIAHAVDHPGMIEGVTLMKLLPHADSRGSLCEMLTVRDRPIDPIVHTYQVTAPPGSIRAWVYHRRQHDRLAFMNGRFEIILFDIRPGSSTPNLVNVFFLGSEQPSLLRIPPLVVHGVRNAGSATATFVNFPTAPYDFRAPDKCRLAYGDPRIPLSFNEP